ncbi:MAG: pyridoxal phosphate-dependent aminotransferase [Thermoanaerobaculia bacterium]
MSTILERPRSESSAAHELFSDRVQLIDTENAFKIGPHIKRIEDEGHRVIKCNLGEPDFPLPTHIREEDKRQRDLDRTHDTDPQGMLPLREAIAVSMGRQRGLRLTPDRVVVFPGAKPPIGFCQEAYCNPGDEVIYPSPGFPIYESFTRYLGLKPVPLHLREETGFNFGAAELEPLITDRTKIIYLNFPSNPTGGVASKEQLEEIAEVILRKAPPNARVYSDEVYESIIFDGREHVSIASLPAMIERTILVSGVSKTYSWTGGRIGWAVFPTAEEAAVFKNLNINYYSCVPPFTQLGAKLAIESPESLVAIRKMVAAFQERRDVVIAMLNAIEGVSCQMPRGAFYAFPNIGGLLANLGAIDEWNRLPEAVRGRTTPSTMCQNFLLYRYHRASMDRRSFGRIGSDGKHYLRLSIATGMDDLKEACRRIEAASRDRAGFAAWVAEGNNLY